MADNSPMPKLGQGNITVSLGGETLELKPTINAAQVLSQRYGGLQDVQMKIVALDMNVITDVLCLGLGPRYASAKQRQWIAEKSFEAGLSDDTGGIAAQAQMYVLSLMRGGRPLPTKDADEDGVETEGNS